MILKHLELRNFRNYDSLSIDLDPAINEIVGPNGVGKSNLAEAIHYLSLARSWRTSDERLLIKDGADEASIVAEIEEGALHREIEITIGRDKKKIALNGKPIRRLSELSRLVNVIVFSPAEFYGFCCSSSSANRMAVQKDANQNHRLGTGTAPSIRTKKHKEDRGNRQRTEAQHAAWVQDEQ